MPTPLSTSRDESEAKEMENKKFFCPNGHGFVSKVVDEQGMEVLNDPNTIASRDIKDAVCVICRMTCELRGARRVLVIGDRPPVAWHLINRDLVIGIVKADRCPDAVSVIVKQAMIDVVIRNWQWLQVRMGHNDKLEIGLQESPTSGRFEILCPPFDFTDYNVIAAVFIDKETTPVQLAERFTIALLDGIAPKKSEGS
jgi:hypothetical protein